MQKSKTTEALRWERTAAWLLALLSGVKVTLTNLWSCGGGPGLPLRQSISSVL